MPDYNGPPNVAAELVRDSFAAIIHAQWLLVLQFVWIRKSMQKQDLYNTSTKAILVHARISWMLKQSNNWYF